MGYFRGKRGARYAHPQEVYTMIQLNDVSRLYKTDAGTFTGVSGISLDIPPGVLTAVTGKSGSGKSTLLNLLSGIDRPTSGRIVVGGEDLGAMDEDALTRWRGVNVGIIFQFFQLLPTLSVFENLMLPMDLRGVIPRNRRRDRALSLLERTGILALKDKLPAQLSGGEQQRTAISRALVNDPKVILADEPTGNLDTRTAESVSGIFRELAAEGRSVIIVTHDADLASRSDRRILIRDGRVVGRGAEEVTA